MAKHESDDIHPFSFFLGREHTGLLLRRLGAQDELAQADKFEYEVLDAGNLIGRICYDDQALGRKWYWEINAVAVEDNRLRTGRAGSLHEAKFEIAHVLLSDEDFSRKRERLGVS